MTKLSQIWNSLDELHAKGDVGELIALYKKYQEVDLPPTYLVQKARVIQLSEGMEYSVDDAEECLLSAVKIDPMCVDAFMELAFLYDNVYDKPAQALDLFNHAHTLASRMIAEIDFGRANALFQLDRASEV